VARIAVDSDFNSSTREIVCKLEIYFDGEDATPMTITRDDYLVDMDILNESGADSINPLNAISSDEISFRLYNENGLFNPSNKQGALYGKIKTNIIVIPYIKPVVDEEVEWIQMGKYFVTDWRATITGTTADVVANDILYQVFNMTSPVMPIMEDVTFYNFFKRYFKALKQLDTRVKVDAELTTRVPYAYTKDSVVDSLQEMTQGAMAMCISTKQGIISVDSLVSPRGTRAVLTDGDQIISADIQQTALKAYNGVELTYLYGQLTDQIEVLRVQNLTFQGGTTVLDKIAFETTPVRVVSYCSIQAPKNVYVRSYIATPWTIKPTVVNETGEVATGTFIVNGFAVNFVENYLVDEGDKLLSVRNEFIQKKSYARSYKDLLNRFVSNDIPTLTLSVRGNPLLCIGDKVQVKSAKYNLDYTGVIQRLKYRYDGGLTCEMTLLNSDILGV
jgi:hypothetical protein